MFRYYQFMLFGKIRDSLPGKKGISKMPGPIVLKHASIDKILRNSHVPRPPLL